MYSGCGIIYCTVLRSRCGVIYCTVLYFAAQWIWCNLLHTQLYTQQHLPIHNKTTFCNLCTVPFPVVQLNNWHGVLSYAMQYAVRSMQYAVRSMQYAVCSMQYAVRSMQYAVCSMQYAVCSTQYAVRNMQYARTLPVTCSRFVSAGPSD